MIASVYAEDNILVKKIIVRGNKRVEESTILSQIKVQTGVPFATQSISIDVKEIYRLGFFEQVSAKLESVEGQPSLVFYVSEKPAIRKVTFEGNKEVKEDTIKEKLSIGARYFLDKKKINAGIDELKKYYQSEGYYDTTVDYEVSPVGENQVDLKFSIIEGEKKLVREVKLEGISKIDEDDLYDVLHTGRYKWWNSWIYGTGVVKQEELENDVREMSKYYLTHGFIDAKISPAEVENIPEGIRVVYKIDEGEQFSVGEIKASGDLIEDDVSRTIADVESNTGEVFNVELLRKDTFRISEKFTDTGYAFANVDPNTSINRETKKVDINFVIDKGNLVYVRRINITGNKKTEDRVVRRSLQLPERSLFSSSKIRRSQELLQRLGYFDEVAISPEPSDDKNEVDLGVLVKEGSTGTFSIGAGISSGDGFIFTSRVSENNLFGSGNSVTLDINTGSRRENYVVSFTNPRVNDSRLSLGFDILSTKREFDDFDREQRGGSITAGYPLWFLDEDLIDDYRASLSYELLDININDLDEDAPLLVKEQAGKTVSSSVTPQLTRNTIDNPLDPTNGSRQQVSVELAGLGGDQEFWLAQASNSFYYPLWDSPIGQFIFSQRLRFGYGKTFDNKDFPLFRRFFPGGINSVRGYDARELGPKDELGNEFGGNKQLVANFEIIFPLIKSAGLSAVTFYDAGQAFDDDKTIKVNLLRQAIGWGIRWKSPLAPIRLEFGYPIDREPGEKGGVVTNFSFGSPS